MGERGNYRPLHEVQSDRTEPADREIPDIAPELRLDLPLSERLPSLQPDQCGDPAYR